MLEIITRLHPYYPIFLFLSAAMLSYFFMPLILRIAIEKQMVVKPDSRTSHEGNIPNIGGVNVFMSMMLAIFSFYFWREKSINYVLFGAVIVFITGFIDDIISIKPINKLIGQFIGIWILVFLSQTYISNFYGIFEIGQLNQTFSYLFTFFVAIVIVNSINLIDGIDGLAAGMGVVVSLFLGIYFYLVKDIDPSFVAFALCGALSVFFFFNVFGKKTKIFLGDSGSLIIGYFITYMLIRLMQLNVDPQVVGEYYIASVPAVAISAIGIPLFDTMRVFVLRVIKRNSPFLPDKNHIHHHLTNLGLSHLSVSLLMIAVNTVFLIIALLLSSFSFWIIIGVNVLFAIILMQILLMLERRKK